MGILKVVEMQLAVIGVPEVKAFIVILQEIVVLKEKNLKCIWSVRTGFILSNSSELEVFNEIAFRRIFVK